METFIYDASFSGSNPEAVRRETRVMSADQPTDVVRTLIERGGSDIAVYTRHPLQQAWPPVDGELHPMDVDLLVVGNLVFMGD